MAVLAASTVAAALGYGFLSGASGGVIAVIQSFAAGAILTMLADTMMPEAMEHAGALVGLVTVAGLRQRVLAVDGLSGAASGVQERADPPFGGGG